MINVSQDAADRISQGDIYKDIDYIQKIIVEGNEIEIHNIVFPYVVVLTQDCDLEQNARYFAVDGRKPNTDDKKLLSVIVCPLYNEEMFLNGSHLADPTLGMEMGKISKRKKGNKETTNYRNLRQNETARYHHIVFPDNVDISNSVIDFKHYFTVNVENLMNTRKEKFVCRIEVLFRELLSQRFANYLARIGLPSIVNDA